MTTTADFLGEALMFMAEQSTGVPLPKLVSCWPAPTAKATPGPTWPSSAATTARDICAEFPRKRKLPHPLRRNSSSVFDPAHGIVQVLKLQVSKGLEFPVVALVGAGHMPAPGEDEREEARLFYVGATRATQRLVIGASGGGKFAARL
jgi:UvrD-like helicase C-terminal domain